MKLGIIGLPNVGKTTLFNCLTKSGAVSANYSFATVDPNIGSVTVPDVRLDWLAELNKSQKTIYAAIEFVDVAGLVKGSSAGEGIGNRFLSYIREVDAIVHVVRLFEDENIVHATGGIEPLSDIETINLELIFSDLEIIEKRIVKTEKSAKADKTLQSELALLYRLRDNLSEGVNIRNIELSADEKAYLSGYGLLSSKPVIYAANIDESQLEGGDPRLDEVKNIAEREGSKVFTICAKIEEEIVQLPDDERELFLTELGLEKSALDSLITASYELLGLISFLTAGPKEAKAWTIKNGTKAQQAAGKIHSDLERGFIRAEIVAYDDLRRLGNYHAAKDAGLVRLEGKEYVMKDGDVTLFRFNV